MNFRTRSVASETGRGDETGGLWLPTYGEKRKSQRGEGWKKKRRRRRNIPDVNIFKCGSR